VKISKVIVIVINELLPISGKTSHKNLNTHASQEKPTNISSTTAMVIRGLPRLDQLGYPQRLKQMMLDGVRGVLLRNIPVT